MLERPILRAEPPVTKALVGIPEKKPYPAETQLPGFPGLMAIVGIILGIGLMRRRS